MSSSGDLAGLVIYLTARYDEAEELARGVEDNSEPWPGRWDADGNRAVRTYNGHVLAYATHGEFKPGFAAYVADRDPASRLADIALKRALLAEYLSFREEFQRGDVGPGLRTGTKVLEDVVRQLGTEFSRRADYLDEWRP